MRRLKKEHYDGLRSYAKHYSNKDFELLVQQLESLAPQPFYFVPIASARDNQYSASTLVSLQGDAFEEVGK